MSRRAYAHVLNRSGLGESSPLAPNWQRPRADGILLTKRPREPQTETPTANSAKSQGFETSTRPQKPSPAAALMLFFAGDHLVRQPWPQLGAKEFWRRRPSDLGRNSGFTRRRSSRLYRRPQDSEPIAKGTDRGNCPEGAATPPLRSRRCGWALSATSVDSAPRSSPGRPISRSRLRGNAMAGARTSDVCRHPRLLTNSFRFPPEILLAGGAVFAAMAGAA